MMNILLGPLQIILGVPMFYSLILCIMNKYSTEYVDLYIHSLIRLHDEVVSWLSVRTIFFSAELVHSTLQFYFYISCYNCN
jgi:LEA14-like dessication related protein